MKDINGQDVKLGSVLVDEDNNKYSIIKKNGELYAKSLFSDSGCGEYFLYQDRIDRNKFRIIS